MRVVCVVFLLLGCGASGSGGRAGDAVGGDAAASGEVSAGDPGLDRTGVLFEDASGRCWNLPTEDGEPVKMYCAPQGASYDPKSDTVYLQDGDKLDCPGISHPNPKVFPRVWHSRCRVGICEPPTAVEANLWDCETCGEAKSCAELKGSDIEPSMAFCDFTLCAEDADCAEDKVCIDPWTRERL